MGAVDAVAAGAVLRALDKDGGPRTVAKTGYGLGIYEPYDKEIHGNQTPIKGIQDPNEKYIRIIKWASKLVSRSHYRQKGHARLIGAGKRGSAQV
jgi:hypothetical protein